jgi:hypothetical protein
MLFADLRLGESISTTFFRSKMGMRSSATMFFVSVGRRCALYHLIYGNSDSSRVGRPFLAFRNRNYAGEAAIRLLRSFCGTAKYLSSLHYLLDRSCEGHPYIGLHVSQSTVVITSSE